MEENRVESQGCSQTQQMKMDSTGTWLCVCACPVAVEMKLKSPYEPANVMECVCMCV